MRILKKVLDRFSRLVYKRQLALATNRGVKRKTITSMTMIRTTRNSEPNPTTAAIWQPCTSVLAGLLVGGRLNSLPLYMFDGGLAQGQMESIKDFSIEDRRHQNTNI